MKDSISDRYHGLDTLRAAAIALVFLFHRSGGDMPSSLRPIASFGWMGVDLFFVLSGYLIGTQLLRAYAAGSLPLWRSFYRRRLYRVLPAYLAVLLLYLLVPMWWEAPHLSPVWQFLTFTENLFVDYAHNQAFSHAWSLCVEEHFYLLLPPLVGLLMLRPSLAKAVVAAGTLVLIGIGLRAMILHTVLQPMEPGSGEFAVSYIERIYYPTWTRLDGLVAGVVLAAVKLFRPAWWEAAMKRGHLLTAMGASFVAVCLWLFQERFDSSTGPAAWGTIIGFPLLSLGLALLVGSALSRDGILSRVKVPGARTVALLAYSLYLTHKETMHLIDQSFPSLGETRPWTLFLLYLVSSLAVAWALYATVERPFLILRDVHEKRSELKREMLREPAL